MDGLDEFEKSLAAERAERERATDTTEDRGERRHRHKHHRQRDRSSERRESRSSGKDREHKHHHRHSERRGDDDGHRHKRSRHSPREAHEPEASSRHGHRHREAANDVDGYRGQDEISSQPKDTKDIKFSDSKLDLPLPDEEKTPDVEDRPPKTVARDAWMTAPSALDVDYIHRRDEGANKKTQQKDEPKRVLHHRELNMDLLTGGASADPMEGETASEQQPGYKFGDEGSEWRMTKLKAVYSLAEQTGRPLDEVAIERFGSLREFDDAREEKNEMERRERYGNGYVGKDKPTGELYRDRRQNPEVQEEFEAIVKEPEPVQARAIPDPTATTSPTVDQSMLNRLRAQMMKAKLRGGPEAARLEAEYEAANRAFSDNGRPADAVVLDAMHNRMLAGPRGEVKNVEGKRGRERGQVEQNEDMSIDDMLREERRTRNQVGGEGYRLAERIAKDSKFDDDLEYLDENAEKLAKRVHKTEASLKNVAVAEYQKLNKILDKCPLCHHEDRPPPQDLPIAPLLSLATRVFLTLPTEPELTGAEGGAIIVPISHRKNLLECDDDEWEEMRNFMKSLTRLYHEQGRDVVFYENAVAPHRHLHAALVAVPIPYELGDTAPAFFKEAMLSADEEWSQHKKIIDTGKKARDGLGKLAFRRTLTKEMPYFHVWFNLDGGLGHIVEDADRWPRGDLFAREIIGGMLDVGPDIIKKQGRWSRSDPRTEGFQKRWRKFDWTRVLTEGA